MIPRIGWIGCGTHAGEMLLPQLVRLPVRLVALADVNAERLALIGDRYGVARRYADGLAMIESMATSGELDAIGMAVGPKQHSELAAAALRRGLPVFIEKPPAATSAEAQVLADLARAAGKPCVVGFMKRYSTANRIAGNITRGAGFGPRASLLGEYMTAPTYFVGNADYTGFLLHHCVHAMDLVPWLLKEDVVSTQARSFEIAPGKLLLHVGFGFASGALATVVMGTHQSRGTPMEWWQVMGDQQRVEVRNVHEVRHFRNPPFKAADPAATLDAAVDTLVWEPNFTAAANEDHKGYHGLLAAFGRAVRGEANDAPDIADGVKAMRVLEAVVRSMGSGTAERV